VYFPYFYGRTAELLAITESAHDFGSPQQFFPLIEAVRPSAALRRCLDAVEKAGKEIYVIVNPSRGKLQAPSAQTLWQTEMTAHLAKSSVVRPTFRQDDSTPLTALQAFVKQYSSRAIGVVLTSNAIAPADVAAALSNANAVVFLMTSVNRTAYSTAVGSAATIDVEDNFQTEARNADYVGTKGQGTNHLTWTGRAGFSDFTVLPAVFKDGGGPTGAVAVHLTYEEPAELRVQHFVSTITSSGGAPSPKFAQALNQLVAQVAATPTRFRKSPALDDYLHQAKVGQYTSPERNKRLQIIHHLFTVARHLGL
jgi:hypothetical protein